MKRSAAEIAAQDQAQALVRELAAGGMPVMFIADPNAPTSCVWCDCPDDAGPDHVHAGCTEQAEVELSISPPPPGRNSWPVCRGHYADAFRVVQLLLISAMPGG